MSSGVRGGAWDPEVIDQAIPLLKEPSHNGSHGVPSGEPPVPLKGEDSKVWYGERFATKEDGSGEIDRSKTLWWIGCALARAMKNMPISAEAKASIIAEALAERDATLKYQTYSNRSDAQVRYAEIADKALEDVASQADLKVVRLPSDRKHRADQGRRDSSPPDLDPAFTCTDLGNSRRFAAKFDGKVIHSLALGGYGVWDGKRFVRDTTRRASERAKDVALDLMDEARKMLEAGNGEQAQALAKWAIRSCDASRINAVLDLARSEPNIAVHPDDLDSDSFVLNCNNGTLDLRTGELRAHDPADRITKLVPVDYDKDAEAPTWEKFLERVLPSEALRKFVQKLIGYCLSGSQAEQILPFFYGPGANGKTTLVNTILEVLGDYAQQAAPDLLMMKTGAHPTELAELKGRRFVASVEVEDGRRLAESLVKQLTGGERVRGRFMRQDFFEFDPTHHVILVANHRPVVRGTDHAIWRRIKLVPFNVTIPKADQDPSLPEKLREELPGILRWAFEGYRLWQSEGLGEPEEVRCATEEYREEQDVLGTFIDECCYVDPDAWAKFSTLYGVYTTWCEKSGEKPLNKRGFGSSLKERGFPPERGAQNVPIRVGIGIRDDAPRPDGERLTLKLGDGNQVTQESGNDGGETPKDANSGPKVAQGRVTGLPKKSSTVTPEKSCKSQENEERVTQGYPRSGMNSHTDSHVVSCGTQGNQGNLGNPDPLLAWLSDPPEWFQKQADDCLAEGMPDRLLNALTANVTWAVYQDMSKRETVFAHVRTWIEAQHGKEGT